MNKLDRRIIWGGQDNTTTYKMNLDDIKGQNSALNEQEKIQGRLLQLEEKITKAKSEAKKGDEASI